MEPNAGALRDQVLHRYVILSFIVASTLIPLLEPAARLHADELPPPGVLAPDALGQASPSRATRDKAAPGDAPAPSEVVVRRSSLPPLQGVLNATGVSVTLPTKTRPSEPFAEVPLFIPPDRPPWSTVHEGESSDGETSFGIDELRSDRSPPMAAADAPNAPNSHPMHPTRQAHQASDILSGGIRMTKRSPPVSRNNGDSSAAESTDLRTPRDAPLAPESPADDLQPASDAHESRQPRPAERPNVETIEGRERQDASPNRLPAPGSALESAPLPESTPSVAAGDYPHLPPDPDAGEPLLPLEIELYEHGGSYLYSPEGDRLGWPAKGSGEHYEVLRVPEDYVAPEPATLFADFLGADPITPCPTVRLPGHNGYGFEPRFVGYGSYSLFQAYFKQAGVKHHLIGHNAIVDMDLRLTGTERFHVQFRPLGEGNTGGSFYSINPHTGYVDNSAVEPARYWVEGAIDSIFGGYLSDFRAYDYNFVAGKFPFQLHNDLLLNDEILGAVIAKNNVYLGKLSNLNWQLFYGWNDVNASGPGQGQLVGSHLQWEYKKWFFEGTYAHLAYDRRARQTADWTALSVTKYAGPWTYTGRALAKWGDPAGVGDGRLFTLEANKLVYFDRRIMGVDHAVLFANGFAASRGWESIAGANFNRIRTAFEVNPLTQIAAGGPLQRDTVGASFGGQFFWDHENQAVIPEVAFESPTGEAVYGAGLRYWRKVGKRSFYEVLSLMNFSDDPAFERRGVFSSFTFLF